MTAVSNNQIAIIRTERGMTIAGTRITIYDIMDFLKAQYPPKLIRDRFNLTDAQINSALSYIDTRKARELGSPVTKRAGRKSDAAPGAQ